MASGSIEVPAGEAVAPLNFIYACGVCCYSFADVYEGRNETVKGFSDGINPKDRLVTHLYLANCCHVFCGTHLEGGGPSFHAGGQRPKAPCPVCIREKGDSEPRDLYSIRGFHKSEYDPMIPPAWFTTPPISFEGNDKGTEALRFQYLALTRYCQNTHATRKPLQDALAAAEHKLASVQDIASEEHAKVLALQQETEGLKAAERTVDDLKAEVERLRGIEHEVVQYRRLEVNPTDLATFKTNKDAIRHYLKLVPMLIDQNDKMKKRLASLGFAMALEPIPNFTGLTPNELDHDIRANDDSGASLRKTASSHTAGRSAHTPGVPTTMPSSPFIQRPAKRQRLDSPLPGNARIDPPTSRDAMPPPQKPVSRMRSVRKIFPTLRKKFSVGRSTPAPDAQYSIEDDVAMYEDEQWDQTPHSTAGHEQPPWQGVRGDAPYMSGALPVEESSHVSDSRASRLLSSIGVESERPDFTFRASSPVKMGPRGSSHQPVQLPTEPSYIRLMDGLSRDDGMELGLRDPRESSSIANQAGQNRRQAISHSQRERRHEETNGQEDWRETHNPYHKMPNGPYFSTGAPSDSPPSIRTDNYHDGLAQHRAPNPITPAPRKQQRPHHQIESVVSPFVQNSSHNLSRRSNNTVAEPQGSSNHFAAYRSPRSRMAEPESRWREPRGLNGLSFFESPVISKSQSDHYSLQRSQIDRPPQARQYQSRNLNSSGFITRPETGRSPFFRDSAYGSSRDRHITSSRQQQQQHMQSGAVIPFPAINRSLYPRTGQVPSSRPSIVSGRSPVRTQPQWQGLQRMGVRSSRHEFSSMAGNTHANPSGNMFPGAGRHSVRR